MNERKDLYPVGEQPPLGYVPPQNVRLAGAGGALRRAAEAFKVEAIDVPQLADDEVLVYVMAAGVNYNNVWAALGIPVDVIEARNKAGETEDFHIGGSDASGIVYAVGKDVTNVKVGDEVVVHCGMWEPGRPVGRQRARTRCSPILPHLGLRDQLGQLRAVHQGAGAPVPAASRSISPGKQAAAYMLVGATAYRMLYGWAEHALRKGDVVPIWGGAGGLGSMAIQIVRAAGGRPVAVVERGRQDSSSARASAPWACINRRSFDHWGMLPHWKDTTGYNQWLKGARAFGKAIWDVLGEREAPASSSSTPARPRSRRRSSSATPAAWS